ncbi:PREDICTED: uncharacterized protein LOC109242227 [Nicotiana attenuata]|uniref:B2 protein n=1 Tax=Nicotiana attenuata TaxID=49451 RepID=A0A314L3W9_NICAT|nr:PREDICTED: uncharacterized protein LOC109242227 [Nicotiana attenuata]XP_019264628.1 PREDICTED: uncharacterized protein LOC109242227 [Nicotiana attenuata]OIT36300.1 b2 protein [Nicotiana attenuata]
MASKKNKKKRNNPAASSSGNVPRENKTPKELKAKGKLAKKSSNLNSAQMKEAEGAPQSQSRNKEKASKDGNQGNNFDKKDARKSQYISSRSKEKRSTSEMSVDVKNDGKTEKSIGGVIFMCNAKTKDDCFRYHVMGVSAMKKDIIMGIKPGVKLFLFDFDLKLMYGIFEASSSGGMKLEPAAFGGDFPAQVRFRIDRDCLPLPENLFKRAIKDNYDERTHKFKIELTSKQVEQLIKLFRPAPWLHPTSKHSVSEPVIWPTLAAPLPREEPSREHVYGMQYSRSKAGENFSSYSHERQQLAGHYVMPREVESQPRFLTEKEYRSYGLQSAKHLQPTASAVVDRKLDHYDSEQGREQLRRNPASVSSDATLARKETVYSEPLFPSEREYRTYGLKARSGIPVTVAPAVESSTTVISAIPTNHGLPNHVKDTYNPYDESTASLVNRYLSLPRTVVTPVESYSSAGRESFAGDPYSAIDIRGDTRRFHTENERVYPPYAPQLPPDYGLKYQHLRDEPRYSSTSVSSRYSFGGPSAPRH